MSRALPDMTLKNQSTISNLIRIDQSSRPVKCRLSTRKVHLIKKHPQMFRLSAESTWLDPYFSNRHTELSSGSREVVHLYRSKTVFQFRSLVLGRRYWTTLTLSDNTMLPRLPEGLHSKKSSNTCYHLLLSQQSLHNRNVGFRCSTLAKKRLA